MDADFILVQRMKNGSEEAMETFVRKYYPQILKYCMYHAPDRWSAQDLTQETFERFFAAFPRYLHKGKLANYLYVIAGNLCRDAYGRNHMQDFMPLPEEVLETEANPLIKVEERVALGRALYALPEEFRQVIILYYFQNLKLKEIAQILGIQLPLVKYRLRRAKELLAKEIGEEDGR